MAENKKPTPAEKSKIEKILADDKALDEGVRGFLRAVNGDKNKGGKSGGKK